MCPSDSHPATLASRLLRNYRGSRSYASSNSQTSDDHQPSAAKCARIDSYGCISWQPQEYPEGETSASLEEKRKEMVDIFSREGLRATERGRVKELMTITYTKQLEDINANPPPSILDISHHFSCLGSSYSPTSPPSLVLNFIAGDTVWSANKWMLSTKGCVVTPHSPPMLDFINAMAVLFTSFYVFNIEYQVEAATTLEFVQRFLSGSFSLYFSAVIEEL
ncbi:uncharacterized protein LOC121889907 [Thunnus maccoyii]|uniref:uncharacterized protein LOC121889907 n=1 Tax=Thunnus maccoyii TaxID=8240 RepID=UPI001C4BED60|nr:uncharacterized protein LOC121889907 [Thunnus maccoyii]